MQWWDGVDWDALVRMSVNTTAMIPSSTNAAVVDDKLRSCRGIEATRDVDAQAHEWMWKLLCA
eukprot:10381837-Lingulodinium_polyedra.AAC.1